MGKDRIIALVVDAYNAGRKHDAMTLERLKNATAEAIEAVKKEAVKKFIKASNDAAKAILAADIESALALINSLSCHYFPEQGDQEDADDGS